MSRIQARLAGQTTEAKATTISFTATEEQRERIDAATEQMEYKNRSNFINDAVMDAVDAAEKAKQVKEGGVPPPAPPADEPPQDPAL